jgi:ParE toxin of type II toxin-antitoxin system, parDE
VSDFVVTASDTNKELTLYKAHHALVIGIDKYDVAAFARIASSPLRPRALFRDNRRVHLRRFPYVVLYVARGEVAFVLAILHERRNPRLFQSRARAFDEDN